MDINVKSKKGYYLLGFIVLMGVISMIVMGYLSLHNEYLSLQEFVVGRWVGEYIGEDNGIPYREYYQLEFVKPNKIIFNMKTHQSTTYNDLYSYRFIGENRLEIRSRNVDEWELLKVNDSLYIRSRGNLVKYMPFRRVPSISWGIVALIFGIIIIVIFMIAILPVYQGNLSRTKIVTPSKLLQWARQNSLRKISIFFLIGIAFIIGWFSSMNFWESYSLRTIRLPWDTVISIEIGILFLLFGVKTLLIGLESPKLSPVFAFILNSVGVFVLGWGAYGVILGLSRLILILFFGQYPSG